MLRSIDPQVLPENRSVPTHAASGPFLPKWLEPQLTHTSSRLNMTNSPEQQTNDGQNSDNRKDKRGSEIREPDADHNAPLTITV